MVAHRTVRPCHERRVDLPAERLQHPVDSGQGADDHAGPHADHASSSIGRDHLGIAHVRQRPPAGLRRGACRPRARGLHPGAHGGPQRRAVILEPIGEHAGPAARGQHLNDLIDQPLRPGQGTRAHVDRSQACARRGERSRRSLASAAVIWPALTTVSTAEHASRWTWLPCTSCSRAREPASRWSAASIHHASMGFGSTVHTRATARMPSPSAKAPTAHTTRSGATRGPCMGGPCVSRTAVPQAIPCSCRHRPALG